MNKIRQLGRLYDNELDDDLNITSFQTFLDTYDINGTTETYDTTFHMRRVINLSKR